VILGGIRANVRVSRAAAVVNSQGASAPGAENEYQAASPEGAVEWRDSGQLPPLWGSDHPLSFTPGADAPGYSLSPLRGSHNTPRITQRHLYQRIQLLDHLTELGQGVVDAFGLLHVDARAAQQVQRVFRAAALEEVEVIVQFRVTANRQPARDGPGRVGWRRGP